MIKYKGIEFETVDQLIEYQEKAEGLKKPNKGLLSGGYFEDPPPFYPRQPDPWTKLGPGQVFFNDLNKWSPPLSPQCVEYTLCQGDGIIDTVITNMHCR